MSLLGGVSSATRAADPPRGIYVVPQSHIDVAWWWRYDPETIEVCIPSTFGRAAENLDLFPDYSYSASQVPLYEGMRQYHPALAARVAQRIREGRWEIVGGHWVEFEGAGPCGEALVRQCVYGKRYFKEFYGVDVRNAWQIDAWTHPWTLPQILSKCEIDTYVFERGRRDEDIFWWESADGSRVLAVKPYFEIGTENHLKGAIERHRQIRDRYGIDISMYRYGKGDHGGGMERDKIEELKQQMAHSEVPAHFSRADTFLKDLTGLNKKDWPVLHDELGFELTGCLSNTGRLKAANRRSENLLIQAEIFAVISARVAERAYPQSVLKQTWQMLLFNQFHDIMGGCVIPAGYEDALQAHAQIQEQAQTVRRDSMSTLAEMMDTRGDGVPVVVFNSLSWNHSGPAEVSLEWPEKPDHIVLTSDNGESTPAQILAVAQEGDRWKTRCVFVAHDVPGIGYRTYWARRAEASSNTSQPSVRVEPWRIENNRFTVTFDSKTGDMVSVRDRQRNREILPKDGKGNEIQILQETGDTEGTLKWGSKRWTPDPLDPLNGWKVVENGPIRATVRIRNKMQNFAAVDRYVTLYADPDMPWIACRTHFEWNGVDKMVKIAFPTQYPQAKPTFDIPYGTIVRPADGEERPALQWVDLGDEAGGFGLLNDCRYGHDVRDGVIRLDAIRSHTRFATHTEAGHQEVTYAIYPHSGDWRQGQVMQRGYEFNNPPIAVVSPIHVGRLPARKQFVRSDHPNVILSVLKRAEDSDHLIARAYEIWGNRCEARFDFAGLSKGKAALTNMLEKPSRELSVESISSDTKRVTAPIGAYEILTFELE